MDLQKSGFVLIGLLLILLVFAPVVSAADGSIWTQATNNAQYNWRYNHASAVFDNKMWVIAGEGYGEASGKYSDVWSSSDGQVWTQTTPYAFTPRKGMSATVYNGNMWIFGGIDNSSGGGFKNDVWHSADGTNWYRSTANAQWTPRHESAAVTYDNMMWVLGGYDWGYPAQKNDVWYSTDGITWSERTSAAAWSARQSHSAVSFQSKMWILGGQTSSSQWLNDVWYSTDGLTWTQATANAPWPARRNFAATVYDEKLWIMGGYGSTGELHDVWFTSDGTTWTQATSAAGWPARDKLTAVTFGDTIWILGGTGAGYLKDVWYAGAPPAPVAAFSATPTSGNVPLTVQFTDGSTNSPTSWAWDFNNDGTTDSTVQNPSFTYNAAGTYSVKLTATNAGGSNTLTKTSYITVTASQPVAAFSGTPTYGVAPLTVQFTDGSTNTPTSWAWDFNNDGTVDSTAQNPSFTFNAAGTYSVRLTATNAGGSNSSTLSDYITVSSATGPVLSFQPVSAGVYPGETTDYILVLSSAPGGFSGYNISVALTDPAIGTITNVTYPSWKILTNTSALPSGNVRLKLLGNTSATTNITLCTIQVQGTTVGTTDITVTASKITDGSGGQISPSLVPGTLTVNVFQPIIQFPGQTNAPTDPNNDGLYEDINGNGNIEMNDVLVYYYNMVSWIAANEPIAPFDYNNNGLIDFDDVVRLFDMA